MNRGTSHILALVLFHHVSTLPHPSKGGKGGGATHEFSHTALLHGGLITTIDFRNVIPLDLGDVLVHRQVSRCRVVQYVDAPDSVGRLGGVPKGTVRSYRKLQSSPP